ncbi:MAG: hypothetical protein KF819_34575 [Labilithrix sp.]|nr:hypothetical protein [Labilithrix sp.]
MSAPAWRWRREDEDLLQRLEDETVLGRLFRHHVGAPPGGERAEPHPRAAGLVASARALPGGSEAVDAALRGDVAKLARFIEAGPMRDRPPVFLHHVAVYYGKVAAVLEGAAPDAAANAWMRSLAAWLALDEERTYLASIEEAVLGASRSGAKRASPEGRGERAPLEVLADLGKRAEVTSRDLAPAGRAALLALAWVSEAGRIAGVGEDATRRAEQAAERRRNAALDAALAVVGEALDEANVRGELGSNGRAILTRALDVWKWSGHDEAVEQFVVDRLATIGWELYRARAWDALRYAFDPFRPLIEHFAARIEGDPASKIAFAGPCAQMFVFLTDIEPIFARKLELAERAIRICPTHRNGRLNLASLLCDQAIAAMGATALFVRREELERIEALLARAESLYPASTELPEAKAMLERCRRRRIAL